MCYAATGLLLLLCSVTYAEQKTQKTLSPTRESTGAQDDGGLALQRARLELDKQKLAYDHDIEEKKLEAEREKLEVERSSAIYSALSSMVPLVVGIGTLGYGLWSFKKQAQLQFETKAAEIAFSARTPDAVLNRVSALKALFPHRLPGNFGGSFKPVDYGGGKEDPEGKKFLLELLVKYPSQRNEIGELWEKLFGGDQWLARIKPLLSTLPPPGQAAPGITPPAGTPPSAPHAAPTPTPPAGPHPTP